MILLPRPLSAQESAGCSLRIVMMTSSHVNSMVSGWASSTPAFISIFDRPLVNLAWPTIKCMRNLRPDWTCVQRATPPFSLVEGKGNLFSQSGYSFRGVADWYRSSRWETFLIFFSALPFIPFSSYIMNLIMFDLSVCSQALFCKTQKPCQTRVQSLAVTS